MERKFLAQGAGFRKVKQASTAFGKKGVLTNFSEIVCASFLLCEKTTIDALAQEIENLRAERLKLKKGK